MQPVEIIACKRDGKALTTAQIGAFVSGLSGPTDAAWSDAQVAALAMAIVLRGMTEAETVALTAAMTHSGRVLSWADAGQHGIHGPILDKHSTGGVGDKVSLLLAPIVAACGGIVPMVSGRGLGHTGGTLDKLEALPGYDIAPSREVLLAALRDAGCAIVGASAELAPADRRLYAIRDVTATVESLPLITASILSKKLSAGLQALVLDVKVGSGAFTPRIEDARTLAQSLVRVARGAGLPAAALITDMNQVLGTSAGNALEVIESVRFLTGVEREPRLHEVTLALAARMLHLGGLAADIDDGKRQAERALNSGAAAERFERMVAALGGPRRLLQQARLATAPVVVDVPALQDGWLDAIDVRALGAVVVRLGGGRSRPGDPIDAAVGLDRVLGPGRRVVAGEALARVHAASRDAAAAAVLAVRSAMPLGQASDAVRMASALVEDIGPDGESFPGATAAD